MFWNLFKSKKAKNFTISEKQAALPSADINKDNSTLERCEEPISEKEIFLLHYLHGRKIEWKIDNPVKDLFDDYNITFSSLKERGYLIDDEHSYFLETMNISQLKEILRNRSLSLSGKKAELIQRIISDTSEAERMEICPDLYYVLTEKALKLDKEYRKKQKNLNASLKETMKHNISSGNYNKAVLEKAANFSARVLPPGIGVDWNDTETILQNSSKELKRIKEYDFADLKNSNSYKLSLINALYYDVEIEHNLYKSITEFVIPTGEFILCDELDTFFMKKGFMPDECHKVFVYLDTKRYNQFQVHMRDLLKDEKYKPLPPGQFKLADSTLNYWKEFSEYKSLSEKGIENFPKTFQTYQKHKNNNSEKYKTWIQ